MTQHWCCSVALPAVNALCGVAWRGVARRGRCEPWRHARLAAGRGRRPRGGGGAHDRGAGLWLGGGARPLALARGQHPSGALVVGRSQPGTQGGTCALLGMCQGLELGPAGVAGERPAPGRPHHVPSCRSLPPPPRTWASQRWTPRSCTPCGRNCCRVSDPPPSPFPDTRRLPPPPPSPPPPLTPQHRVNAVCTALRRQVPRAAMPCMPYALVQGCWTGTTRRCRCRCWRPGPSCWPTASSTRAAPSTVRLLRARWPSPPSSTTPPAHLTRTSSHLAPGAPGAAALQKRRPRRAALPCACRAWHSQQAKLAAPCVTRLQTPPTKGWSRCVLLRPPTSRAPRPQVDFGASTSGASSGVTRLR